jgi:hypothetical protein
MTVKWFAPSRGWRGGGKRVYGSLDGHIDAGNLKQLQMY